MPELPFIRKSDIQGVCVPVTEENLESLPDNIKSFAKLGDTMCYDGSDKSTWVILENVTPSDAKSPAFHVKAGGGPPDKQKQLVEHFKRKII